MPDFLLEIGTEEIPARMIDAARTELSKRVADLLARERLAESAQVEAISTPRRLAVLAREVREAQPDIEEQLTGPAVKVAFKDGEPTPAAQAFAKKAGIDVSQITRITTPKGEYIAATVTKRGRTATEILTESLPKEIAGIYWAKNMYWRPGAPRFVRPVRWIVSFLGNELVPLEFGGVKASDETRGHRLLANEAVRVSSASGYGDALAKAKVVPQNEREALIRKQLDAAARKLNGRWREDADLLSTVVNLTEFPSVIIGNFEREYLELPEEVLVTVMRDHQKYFAVQDSNGKLAPHFLAVLNTDGDPDGTIAHGHQRVLRARFNDARFFWNTDQKTPLKQRVDSLKSVTFQKDLGSYHEKSERMVKLVAPLAEELAQRGINVDRAALHDAAVLAKTDLTTELVKEFTELQGIIGGLYARHQGLGDTVATAIYDQYKPESMEADVPRSLEGALLAIADKADSITGMFGLGMIPSGSKDPFALRRQANGIVKIIADHKLPLSVGAVFAAAHEAYVKTEAGKKLDQSFQAEVAAAGFFRERLEFYLRDYRGFAYDVVNAVLAAGSDDVVDAIARAEALSAVRPTENFVPIAAAFKRIKNILRQAAEKKIAVADQLDTSVLKQEEEKRLASDAAVAAAQVRELRASRNYEQALLEVAKLRPTVDAFFDKVMVMVEDERLRATRLALLRSLLHDFSTIADFSEIVTQ